MVWLEGVAQAEAEKDFGVADGIGVGVVTGVEGEVGAEVWGEG